MRLVVVGLLFGCLLVPVAHAADCESDLAALEVFHDLRETMVRGSSSSYDLARRVEEHLIALRQPMGDGTFRWVRYVRPGGTAPVVRRERLVNASRDDGDLERFEAAADRPYAVRIVVPRKRSLLRGNQEAFVGEVIVRYWVDGQQERLARSVNQWLRPDTTRTFDLGVIADRAEAVVEVGTRRTTREQSLVEIHFQQAVAQDDPASPHAATIQRLKRFSSDPTPVRLDEEIERIEQEVFGRASRLRTAELITTLRRAGALLESEKEEERVEGQKLLDAVFLMLPR